MVHTPKEVGDRPGARHPVRDRQGAQGLGEVPAGAVRYDQQKIPVHLIPPEAIWNIAKIYQYGAEKYAERNWEKGMDWSRMYNSAMRHLLAFWQGQDFDGESGMLHVAHAAWNCIGLLTYMIRGMEEFDDRPGIREGDLR
jgi:hypothetical protein